MTKPKIITDDFLKTCLNYEYLKNEHFPRAVEKNISQMMASDWVRNEIAVIERGAPGPSQPGPSFSVPCTSDGVASEGYLKRKLKPEKTPSKKLRLQEDPCFDSEFDDINLLLLKKSEADVNIQTITHQMIQLCFKRNLYSEEGGIQRDTVMHTEKLSAVREIAYTVFRTPAYGPKRIDEMKVIIGFGNIRIEWINCKYPDEKQITLEYWEAKNGCWLWINDQVRFIEGLSYENLASHEFINTSKFLKNDKWELNKLEFDFERKTKWNGEREHRSFFSQKIKKWMEIHQKKFQSRVFYMTMYENAPAEFQPFHLKFVIREGGRSPETLGFRVWSGAQFQRFPAMTVKNYLHSQSDAPQWENGQSLWIQEEKLNDFHSGRLGKFEKIFIWEANVFFVGSMIMQKLALEPTQYSTCWTKTIVRVRQKVDIEYFKKIYGSENFLKDTWIRVEGSKILRVEFAENDITFELAYSKPPVIRLNRAMCQYS
ncbi:hypothetical protein CAEBREN_10633 [Caenorhabditis brenneri]|uniref:Uncharacterized protein n=1 Tax=Caenorhabditis brenneri TaxID=135651 RepID=G0NC50_CAEBE|nr:hypothetical protein CAEBREN_10633 [Caenorhabditis brenneri]